MAAAPKKSTTGRKPRQWNLCVDCGKRAATPNSKRCRKHQHEARLRTFKRYRDKKKAARDMQARVAGQRHTIEDGYYVGPDGLVLLTEKHQEVMNAWSSVLSAVTAGHQALRSPDTEQMAQFYRRHLDLLLKEFEWFNDEVSPFLSPRRPKR
jgi:hypothetical protein